MDQPWRRYSTLSIWVGGIILVAMMKVTASENLKRALAPLKPHQIYLGRYLLFLVLGLIQSGLICLGDLYFLGIQCEHPFLFLLAGWVSSVVYVNIIYTLSRLSFGDIRKKQSVWFFWSCRWQDQEDAFPDRSGAGNLPEDLPVSSIYAQYDSYAGMCCRILSVYVLGRIGNHVYLPLAAFFWNSVIAKPVIHLKTNCLSKNYNRQNLISMSENGANCSKLWFAIGCQIKEYML